MPAQLSPQEVARNMTRALEWTSNGSAITRTFKFADFAAALDFVNNVGAAAEKANHHPDIVIRWNKVTLTLSTHSEGGLTALDFELASTLDRLALGKANN
ncbi:MAG: 4a-hydroxytetrahydrobiopterin dehydratase [Chthoniobacterales bacterium]